MRTLLSIVAVLLLTVPALAQNLPEQYLTPPPNAMPTSVAGLQVLGCSVKYSLANDMAQNVHVAFVNHNALPITKIRFRIEAGAVTFPVMDVGTFRPQLRITHDLAPPPQQIDAENLHCTVDAYTLSNGKTWISDRFRSEMKRNR